MNGIYNLSLLVKCVLAGEHFIPGGVIFNTYMTCSAPSIICVFMQLSHMCCFVVCGYALHGLCTSFSHIQYFCSFHFTCTSLAESVMSLCTVGDSELHTVDCMPGHWRGICLILLDVCLSLYLPNNPNTEWMACRYGHPPRCTIHESSRTTLNFDGHQTVAQASNLVWGCLEVSCT